MVIDADGQILGRLSSMVAKRALLGESVIVINAEKAIVSGKKETTFGRELSKLGIKSKANPERGPFHYKRPDRFVRKIIRGMLPWKKPRGREAFKRIMVYKGIPERELKKNHDIDIKKEKIEILDKKKIPSRYTTVEDICRSIS